MSLPVVWRDIYKTVEENEDNYDKCYHAWFITKEYNGKSKDILSKIMDESNDASEYTGGAYFGFSMIRIPEMYYIMAEYYARNANFIESGKMLDAVRSARGIISNTSNIISLDDFIGKLLKEVRKELIGEGQLYFQYKRLNNNSFADGVKFVFDRPENEEI